MTGKSQLHVVYHVARNEFARVFYHPLTPAVILLLSFLAVLNGVGGTAHLGGIHNDKGLYYSIGQTFMFTSVYGVVVAVFIGVMSIAEERRNHSLNIILSKPLYRRDLITGKFLGLNLYMLSIIVYSMVLAGLALSIFYYPPIDPLDFFTKIAIYVLIAFVYSSLNIAIALLISTLFKDLLISTTIAMVYIFMDGYVGWTWISPALIEFSPRGTLCHLYINEAANLQDTTLTISQWISANLPAMLSMITAVVLISIIAMAVYTRSDSA